MIRLCVDICTEFFLLNKDFLMNNNESFPGNSSAENHNKMAFTQFLGALTLSAFWTNLQY